MYASPIARFLSSCDRLSIDWRRLEWEALRAYRDQLAREFLEQGGRRKAATVNAHARCVVDFCVLGTTVNASGVSRLSRAGPESRWFGGGRRDAALGGRCSAARVCLKGACWFPEASAGVRLLS